MDVKTVTFDERMIEIIPPDNRKCTGPDIARCDCCRQFFRQQPDDYGLCPKCLEC